MSTEMTIKEIRQRAGLSLQQLSKLSGISTSYLSELETNTKDNPRLKTICSLAKALDVEPSKLFKCH